MISTFSTRRILLLTHEPHTLLRLNDYCIINSHNACRRTFFNYRPHVFHASESRYRDYRQPASDTGELRDGFWVSEYPIEKMNEGVGNNKLIGLHVKHRNHSATLITYRNSYYQTEPPDRSWGLGINRLYPAFNNITLEAGLMLLSGYRPALVSGDKDASTEQSFIVTYTLSSEFKLSKSTSITYTLQGNNVHVTALKMAMF